MKIILLILVAVLLAGCGVTLSLEDQNGYKVSVGVTGIELPRGYSKDK